MKKNLLYLILFLCLAQISHSQENGVVALDLPIRNSLKFNRYAVNPTFSFVREQNRYISFTNKRQWVQFDNAPQAYLFSYSGRFRENIGAGIGLFQQDYGVQTVFGGILNFAYNAVLDRDNNLTFGLNIGAYQSGINEGKVITNFPDPALQNIPKHMLLTVNPGINYGTAFFDFGLSVNNLVSYNLNASKIIEDNPEQSFQAHVMYTGYMDSRGFFDESKFSTLIRSEFKKETTVISGLAILSVPKGMWGQIGYNTLYGASAGVGINISEQIALEYNYEQSVGDLSGFGNSHEVTIAYRFKNNNRYLYSGDDAEKSVFTPKKSKKRYVAKRKPTTGSKPVRSKEDTTEVADNEPQNTEETQVPSNNTTEENVQITSQDVEIPAEETNIEEAQRKAEEAAKLEAEKKAREEAERLQAEQAAKERAERILQEKQKAEAEAKAREEARLKAEAEEKARLEAEKRKAEAAERLKAEEEAKARAEAEEQARIAAERLKAEEEAKAAAEVKAIEDPQQEEHDAEPKPELDEATANSINDLNESAEASKEVQKVLIDRLTEKVAIKQKDLDDLKEENDLSEQGIYVEPKPFKSVSAENAEIETLKEELDKVIEEQRIRIEELEAVYIIRKRKVRDDRDPLNAAYLKAIEALKAQQLRTIRAKADLEASLETINVATEVERKRRIKRAAYDNQQDRYEKDSASLAFIKKYTDPSVKTLTEADFDFGEEPSNNIQIIKNVSHSESGYYMVIAVHDDEAKRDEFLTKVVASGRKDINFFFDVNTNKYFIYYNKFDTIEEAQRILQSKGNEPYNANMSIVKIEN
ncbi:PorP/SprF family type IX secretion system membrane protein [Seonamhaeicola sp.]|uniref:PorP/SprF family type IX secretion system membrane protein n=1 Tax=Seonamhaeicola sp. TaxID=1912245 RepID=UPI002632D44A|nr:PorP/SprF family type IX secretion system membrane protein [Seonamhaeicola sp.]